MSAALEDGFSTTGPQERSQIARFYAMEGSDPIYILWGSLWRMDWRRTVKKQQLELDIEQQTGFKSEKEYVKAVCCHPV